MQLTNTPPFPLRQFTVVLFRVMQWWVSIACWNTNRFSPIWLVHQTRTSTNIGGKEVILFIESIIYCTVIRQHWAYFFISKCFIAVCLVRFVLSGTEAPRFQTSTVIYLQQHNRCFQEPYHLYFVVSIPPLHSFLLLQISDTITGLQLSITGPLTTMEELFTGSKPFLVSTRNCRRLSENVINLLSSISLARANVDAGLGNDSSISGAFITPLTPVPPSVAPTVVPTSGLMPSPFSPGWAANTLMVNEDYRWDCRVARLVDSSFF